MFYDRYDIYTLSFSKGVKELLISKPALSLIVSDSSITGLREYFTNLLNNLNITYSYIFNETNPSILKEKIETLSFIEKIDICIFFKIKSYFNPKITPSIKGFCRLLDINTNMTLNGLFKKLINTTELSTHKLTYHLKVQCVNCKSLIDTDISYLGSSNYTEKQLHCSNCNHKFIFKISDNQREFRRNNIYLIRSIDPPSCNCNSCEKWMNSFTSYIDANIENFRNELITYINNKERDTAPTLSLEQLYKIYKNSLTKTESELLNLAPKNISDIYLLIDEMNSRHQKKISQNKLFQNLIKHGIIYKTLDEDLLKENINNYIKKYTDLLYLINTNKILEVFGGTYGINTREITPPYSINYITADDRYEYINFCSIETFSNKKYCLNPYYFNDSSTIVSPKRYNIFNSPAELTLFNHLSRLYPNYIICPNIPLKVFVKIDKLSKYFAPTELKYLKYCIIDFVITDEYGYVVKCIELQKGDHHNYKDWIFKDALKRKCFEVLGIDFTYEY